MIRTKELDFLEIYKEFDGTIYHGMDCGKICRDTLCCSPVKYGSNIMFLPGEYEYLLEMFGKRLPFKEIQGGKGHYTCYGNSKCIYEIRPIDCRSYPLFPFVRERKFLGFVFSTEMIKCPLRLPDEFIKRTRGNWEKLFARDNAIYDWVELIRFKLKGSIMIFEDYTQH